MKNEIIKLNKGLDWSLRLALGVCGLIILFQIVPSFIKMLGFLIDLYKLTDTTPEFKMLLIIVSLWVNLTVINVIINYVFKLHSLLEDKIIKEEN